MREFTPWLGLCHLRQNTDNSLDAQSTLAAVWTDSVKSFEQEMHVHTNTHDQQMIWAEEVMPADEWLAKHPDRKDAQRLAAKVSKKHPVEIGAFGVGVDGMLERDIDENIFLHIVEHEITDMDESIPWLSKALKSLLFEKEHTSSNMSTYAILDSAVWGGKGKDLSVELEGSDLEWRCLFKGEVEEKTRTWHLTL